MTMQRYYYFPNPPNGLLFNCSYGLIFKYYLHKISLDAMCKKLQAIEHYDDPEKAFNNLLFGYAKSRHYPPEWTSRARKKGWLEVNEALRFAKYCLHKDWWDMIN